jgi:hypothetical protein
MKVAAEEMAKKMKNEQMIMFMYPSGLDEKARQYLDLFHYQILAPRRVLPKEW